MSRVLVLLSLLLSAAVQATEVASITACKPEGETWICASWKDNKTAVYRSDNYISRVEFKGATDQPALVKVDHTQSPSTKGAAVKVSKQGRYTLQLLACNSAPCGKRLEQLKSIPHSREVELTYDNSLWRVLLVGPYATIKSAQQAAAELMRDYQLRDKPWVRSVASVERRMLKP
jgi:septal ring-binding cell division protein DamX